MDSYQMEMLESEVKDFFLTSAKVNDHRLSYKHFPRHIEEILRWTGILTKVFKEANSFIIRLAVYFHDVGHFIGDEKVDHAVKSEIILRAFLQGKMSNEDIEKVAHCVRAHRCKDVIPDTIEAKILAVADSASHMTDYVYIDMVSRVPKAEVLEKLDRDKRDALLLKLPFCLEYKIKTLYKGWKIILNAYPSEGLIVV